jgi:hypothetical protein
MVHLFHDDIAVHKRQLQASIFFRPGGAQPSLGSNLSDDGPAMGTEALAAIPFFSCAPNIFFFPDKEFANVFFEFSSSGLNLKSIFFSLHVPGLSEEPRAGHPGLFT